MKYETKSENTKMPATTNGVKPAKSRVPPEKNGTVNGKHSNGIAKDTKTNGHLDRDTREENGLSRENHLGSEHQINEDRDNSIQDAAQNGHSEEEPAVAKTRAKTARPNGLRASGKPGDSGPDSGKKPPSGQTLKSSGNNKLEPLDQQKKGSAGTTPRSRGSDDSDSDRKVSFRENPQVPQDPPGAASTFSTSSEFGTAGNRSRQNSLSKKNKVSNNGSNGGGGSTGGGGSASMGSSDKVWPATARDTVVNDLARESPRQDGAVTWRKANGDSMLVPRIGSRDADAWSEHSFGYGRCSQGGYELTGRKFTRKTTRGNLGSSTTLSSNTDNSDDAEDNFNVVLRVRPPNAQERNRKDQFIVDFPGDGQVSINNQGTVRNFQFNVVLEPDAAQEDVFETSGMKKLIESAIMGYTCTAFAFGQTGSGKTHTMTGPPAQFHTEGVTPDPNMYGIIQRSFKHLFQQLKKQTAPKYVRASYMEIYNEQVIDLLNPNQRRYLSVRWSKNKGFYVENLFTVECETIDDLMAVLEEGLRNRQTGSHGLNEFSSRSHSVLTVTIDSETQPEPEDENLYVTKRGKISFVDLAGSEKVKDSTAPGGPVMMESNSINKSLLVLGNCISHLGDSKRRLGHIPYRDSKLTKLLADSLGGNGITLMIACITPSSTNATETLNTLRYASRAKKIKSKPTVKMDPREKLIVTLKKEIKILRQENHYLRQQLDFPAKPKGQLQKENDEKFIKFMKEQQHKETGLYEMLQEYMVENETLREENSEMHQTKDSSRREQQILYKENEKLSRRVEELERLMSEHPGTWNLVDHRRTDGYGQHDLSPRGSPVTVGYMSPTHRSTIRPTDLPVSGGRVKASSPTSHGQPKRPPHRLADHVTRPIPRPIDFVEDVPNGYISPRQASLVKAMSPRPIDRKASQVSQTDMIRGMNEQLKKEVMQLDGEIQQHTRGAAAQAMAKSYFR